MTIISTGDLGDSIAEVFPAIFVFLIIVISVAFIALHFIKKSDDNKELIMRNGKVLEKPVQQGNIAWYVVEFDSGERMKLRSFKGNSLFISVGDAGLIEYRGQTIQAFHRQ